MHQILNNMNNMNNYLDQQILDILIQSAKLVAQFSDEHKCSFTFKETPYIVEQINKHNG